MKHLKLILAVPFIAFALMAASCNEKLTTVVIQTCDGLEVAYTHYDAIKEAVSAKTQRQVAFAREQSDRICTNPASTTSVSLAAAAARTYTALRAAFAEGGELNDARVGYSKIENLRKLIEQARRE